MKYHVNKVPWFWRPFWLIYSWILALLGWLALHFLHTTCRIHIEGQEYLHEHENFIYSLWHQYWFLWFITLAKSHRRQAWLQHPAAYMKPIHIVLQLIGIRILLGSGGEEGRKAAERLVELLKQGWSTAISPDGPTGPSHLLKKGVLHIARDSAVPILPVRFEAKPIIRARSWDRKPVPLPFAQITVIFEKPLFVTNENFEEAEKLLALRMGLTAKA